MKELITLQHELNAPKDLYNAFGKYKYRSCEGILAALKPLLAANGCTLTLSDEAVRIGDWTYIKSTATLKNSAGAMETVTAYAREDEEKKGMDKAQLTGSTSSYARKYALNGLFAIDDSKDIDSMVRPEPKPVTADPKATALQLYLPRINTATTRDQLGAISSEWVSKFGKYQPMSDALNNRLKLIKQ